MLTNAPLVGLVTVSRQLTPKFTWKYSYQLIRAAKIRFDRVTVLVFTSVQNCRPQPVAMVMRLPRSVRNAYAHIVRCLSY